jgi:hypothetical protein
VHHLGAVDIGYRNNMLFRSAMIRAPSCGSEKALLDAGIEINAKFNPPLDLPEVVKTARSAWGYEERGENRLGLSRASGSMRPEFVRRLLAPHPRAEELHRLLKRFNGARDGRGESFAASPPAMAEAELIPCWRPHHYRRALALLVELGLLVIVHRGGRRHGDARKFRFGKGAPMKPRLVVSNDDDFQLIVEALNGGASIRQAATAFSLDKSKILRLKHRAAAAGLLLDGVSRGVSPRLSQVSHSEASHPQVSRSEVSHLTVTNVRVSTLPRRARPPLDKNETPSAPSAESETPSESGVSGAASVSPASRGENRAADRENIILGGCMLNLPDGLGGHRRCNLPAGLNGIYCREHA